MCLRIESLSVLERKSMRGLRGGLTLEDRELECA